MSDILGQLEQLSLRSSECIKEALSLALPDCAYGIEALNPTLHKVVSVKLATCEFQNAGVMYPVSCDDLETQLAQCLQALEKSPLYWTSYSGYYRGLHTFCHEESLPYEKDNIVNLFLNITRIYTRFEQDFFKAQRVSEEWVQKMSENMANLEKQLQELTNMLQEIKVSVTQEVLNLGDEISKVLENSVMNIHQIMEGCFQLKTLFERELNMARQRIQDTVQTQVQQIIEANSDLLSISQELSENLQEISVRLEGLGKITYEDLETASQLNQIIRENIFLGSDALRLSSDVGEYLQDQKYLVGLTFQEVISMQTELIQEYSQQISHQHTLQFSHYVQVTSSQISEMLNETIEKLGLIDDLLLGLVNFSGNLQSGMKFFGRIPLIFLKYCLYILTNWPSAALITMILLKIRTTYSLTLLSILCGVYLAMSLTSLEIWGKIT